MAVSLSNATQPGLLAQQYPPPLLPKPGKDNARLQKLLKKNAKKKAAPQTIQTPVPFRSSLSPVNEASPDLEHSDHSTPPRTPETPIYGVSQHPRFTVRPLYQHVPSPYPQRAATYGRAARFSPQPYIAPAHTFPQHVAPLYSYTPPPRPAGVSPITGTAVHAVAPKTPVPTSSMPEVTTPAADVTIQVPAPFAQMVTPVIIKPITQVIKCKSPHPHFKAVDTAMKSPKPMFDVPQIKLYTANTSFYDISMPPLYDSTGLSSIGGTIPGRKTPISEIKRGVTPTFEVKRGLTPTYEIKRSATPTSEVKRGLTPTSEIKRSATPTSEVKRALTPTSEIKRALTPTSEIKRALTPTSEIKRGATPTSEIKRGATPTSEVKRGLTPTLEIKRNATPAFEVKRCLTPTPTYEFSTSRTSSGRPKTPSYHVNRAKTPVFEISKPNPLLFAVSPITTEAQRSKSPTPVSTVASSGSQNQSAPESGPSKALSNNQGAKTPNGEVTLEVASTDNSVAKSPHENISKPEAPRQEAPVVESTRPKTPTAPLGYQRPKTPTYGTPTPIIPSVGYQRPRTPTYEPPKPTTPGSGYQRPKTPSYEVPKAMTPTIGNHRPKTSTYEPAKSLAPSPGYQRPKTPTYGTSPSGVSHLAFRRPKTPTHVAPKPKSTYYGLTPAAYVAHGGIQSFSPSFGISRPKSPTQQESTTSVQELAESKTPSQELPVKTQSLPEVSKPEASQTEVKKTPLSEAIVSTIPTIVVSQASDISEPIVSSDETSIKPTHIAETPKIEAVSQEKSKVKTSTSQPEIKTPEKEGVKTPIYEVLKPKTTTPEAQHPVSAPAKKDYSNTIPPIKAAEQVKETGTKASAVQQKEPKTPTNLASEAKAAGTKPTTPTPIAKDSVPKKPVAEVQTPAKPKDEEDKVTVIPALSTPSASEKKEQKDDSFPAAEPLLKVIQKPKGMKSKLSGWSRLKKHMVVEPEEPTFPVSDSKTEAPMGTGQEQSEAEKDDKTTLKASEKSEGQDEKTDTAPPKALKMWDCVLFQMFATKESIMQQIEANKSEEEKNKEEKMDTPQEVPAFAHRLPVLLFSPRFDAKKLREAASRPLTKMSTVFEMGLIGRKGKDEEQKDYNRTARGFAAS